MREFNGTFANITQRVVFSYVKLLAPLRAEDTDPARQQLHAFFEALYQQIFDHPEVFGLPVSADDAIAPDEPNEKDKKQEVTKKFKKPRETLAAAIDFLLMIGSKGTLQEQTLLINAEDYKAAAKSSLKKFLAGMSAVGMSTMDTPEAVDVYITNTRFPAMMPAFKALADACAGYATPQTARFYFARCDFGALTPGYEAPVMDLYRLFNPDDREQLTAAHDYFISRGYKTELSISGFMDLVVKYQGRRAVKSTPLFQVEYQDRYLHPLSSQIKCASTNRIAPLLPLQSKALQADFRKRIYRCNGDACGWCRNRPSLGPTVIEYEDETITACWYSYSAIKKLDAPMLQLVKEYEQMHEALAA